MKIQIIRLLICELPNMQNKTKSGSQLTKITALKIYLQGFKTTQNDMKSTGSFTCLGYRKFSVYKSTITKTLD